MADERSEEEKVAMASKLRAEATAAVALAKKYDTESEIAVVTLCIQKESLRKETALAKRHELETVRAERQERIEMVRNSNHSSHIYSFHGDVDEHSVRACVEQLNSWDRLDGDNPQPFEIIFSSPGGEVFSGLELFDVIRNMSKRGHYITTVCYGLAASMASILLMSGDKRCVGKYSKIMIHRLAYGTFSKSYENEDRAELTKQMESEILDLFVERVNKSNAKNKITKATIRKNWDRRDWWIFSNSAIDFGLVDEIRD